MKSSASELGLSDPQRKRKPSASSLKSPVMYVEFLSASITQQNKNFSPLGGEGTSICELYRYVPRNRVGFLRFSRHLVWVRNAIFPEEARLCDSCVRILPCK